jgi:hypothetical protein
MGDVYSALFGLTNHSVYGNWQDLLTHHLDDEDGEFFPQTEWTRPRPQYLFAAALLSGETNSIFLHNIIPECPDKSQIQKLIENIIMRVRVADELHEQFLQKQ